MKTVQCIDGKVELKSDFITKSKFFMEQKNSTDFKSLTASVEVNGIVAAEKYWRCVFFEYITYNKILYYLCM